MMNAPDALVVVGDGGVLGMRCLTVFVHVTWHRRPADTVQAIWAKVPFP
jgi:hypothetical protein